MSSTEISSTIGNENTEARYGSVFEKYRNKMWPIVFRGSIAVRNITGGTPSDPRMIEGWLRTKWDPEAGDQAFRKKVAETMVERGVTAEEAFDELKNVTNVNGFKRYPAGHPSAGHLYMEGRQLKAAIKEAASVALSSGALAKRGWGNTNKGLLGYLAEHVMVVEETMPILVTDENGNQYRITEPTGQVQRFVHVYAGDSIKYEEYVEDAIIHFHVATDHDFSEEEWAAIWLKGEYQGFGASRSQGYGRYTLTAWDRVR